MNNSIQQFIHDLSNTKVNKESINHYSLENDFCNGSTAQNNLKCYFTTMLNEVKPKTIMLGEAPGHKGCTRTGVPFTSEAIIGSGKYSLFEYSLVTQGILKKDNVKLVSENTATMVWDTLEELKIFPLMWNAYPYTPVDSKTGKWNRTPKDDEIENEGKFFFNKLLKLFPLENFIAVGRTAVRAYDIFGIKDYKCVRHPSFGGKRSLLMDYLN